MVKKFIPNLPRPVSITLRAAVAIGLLYYVYHQMDIAQLAESLRAMHGGMVLLAVVALIASKEVSVWRMRAYLAPHKVAISYHDARMLYFAGTALNILLPGSIGGDGYRWLWLSRRYPISKKTLLRLVIAERANGLFTLGNIGFCLLPFSNIPLPHPAMCMLAVLVWNVGYIIALRLIMKESMRHALQMGIRYSLPLQAFVLLSALILYYNIAPAEAWTLVGATTIIAATIVATIISILPLSIGGVGVREMIFLTLSPFFAISSSQAVLFGSVMYLTYIAIAVCFVPCFMILKARVTEAQ